MSSADFKSKIDKVFEFSSKKDEINFESTILSLRIVSELQNLMDKLGINQKVIADEIGVSSSYISQIFSGDTNINLKFLAKIQKAFDIKFEFNIQENYLDGLFIQPQKQESTTPRFDFEPKKSQELFVERNEFITYHA